MEFSKNAKISSDASVETKNVGGEFWSGKKKKANLLTNFCELEETLEK